MLNPGQTGAALCQSAARQQRAGTHLSAALLPSEANSEQRLTQRGTQTLNYTRAEALPEGVVTVLPLS